jgi:hypothetical protein
MQKESIKITFLSKEEAAKIGSAGRVPIYRVRYGQRRFVAWAKRDDNLRGAKEIRFEGDEVGGNNEVVIEY